MTTGAQVDTPAPTITREPVAVLPLTAPVMPSIW